MSTTNRKTVLCMHIKKPGGCWKGDECNFAHSLKELESVTKSASVTPSESQGQKKPCNRFHTPQGCPFGSSCLFYHGPITATAATPATAPTTKTTTNPSPAAAAATANTTVSAAKSTTAVAPHQPVPTSTSTAPPAPKTALESQYKFKTAMCLYGTNCRYYDPRTGKGEECRFAHSKSELRTHPATAAVEATSALKAAGGDEATFKTTMCKYGSDCEFYDLQSDTAEGCRFAHSVEELRCVSFARNGFCPDGEECSRKHTRVHWADAVVDPDSMEVAYLGLRPGQKPKAFYDTKPIVKKGLELAFRFPFFELPNELIVEMAQNRAEAVKKPPFIGIKFLSSKYTMWTTGKNGAINISRAQATQKDYIDLMKCLLLTEICQNRSDVRRYDMKNAVITATTNFYCGEPLYRVPCIGLTEKRPSVLRGDAVVARDNSTGEWHRGFVHDVHLSDLSVSFHPKFNRSPNTTYWVIFSAPMVPYRRQLYALDKGPFTLTQDVIDAKAISSFSSSYAIEPLLERSLNDEQRLAVRRLAGAARGDKGSFNLFVMHGPPGTGKTTTVCAAIRCILFNNALIRAGKRPSTADADFRKIRRVLVCTPTNHAANLIVEKLVRDIPGLDRYRLIRLVAVGVKSHDVDERIVQSCFDTPSSTTVGDLENVEVVVTTLVSSGMLLQCGMNTDHFDHIIIDEAGQATEPELSVPLLMAGGDCPCIALVGDHKQLGPVLRSLNATGYGLGDSTMERLMRKAANAEKFSIQLRRSYRSHPEIMNLYNTLTYGGNLICAAPATKTHALIGNRVFPNSSVPIGFFHVEGVENREADSPSWMNVDEVICVKFIVKSLIDSRVSPSEIVVLSPYLKQCAKIRESLFKDFGHAVKDVTVCSVESFQGREATVVILSCVRSTKVTETTTDQIQSIGFLRQPKRLNVAISRAVAGLYIVGNVGLLQTDEGWRSLIGLIGKNRSIRGMDALMTEEQVAALGARYISELEKIKKGGVASSMVASNQERGSPVYIDPEYAMKVLTQSGGNPADREWAREVM